MTIKKFPISRIIVIWSQEGESGVDGAGTGLKEGRVRQGISFQYMFRQSDPMGEEYLEEWWKNFRKAKLIGKKSRKLYSQIDYLYDSTFCPYFGSHFSRDMEATDEEILESFEVYIVDKETNEPDYRFMDADDRSLWVGPCSCEHCIENGVRIIEHKRDFVRNIMAGQAETIEGMKVDSEDDIDDIEDDPYRYTEEPDPDDYGNGAEE